MQNRSELYQKIRPSITVDNSKSTELEIFQSVSLRPILKLQNQLIISLINNYLSENKIEVKNLTDNKKKERIDEIVKGNLQLKTLLTGIVIGNFTDDEIEFYFLNKKEVIKRTITMLLERINSQLEFIQF